VADLEEDWGDLVSEEQLEGLRAAIDTQLEGDEVEEPEDFTVWPANAEAIEVFQRCVWERVLAGDRLLYIGIAAEEIRTVMDTRSIPRERQATVFDLVRYAASTVLPRLNGG
jgi:hypothetical protein